MCRFKKILSFSERGSLKGKNGTITNAQLLVTMEKFNFFENFKIEISNVIFRSIFKKSEIFF